MLCSCCVLIERGHNFRFVSEENSLFKEIIKLVILSALWTIVAIRLHVVNFCRYHELVWKQCIIRKEFKGNMRRIALKNVGKNDTE